MKQKGFAWLLCAVLIFSAFAGCSGQGDKDKNSSAKADSSASAAVSSQEASLEEKSKEDSAGTPTDPFSPIVEEPLELSYYIRINDAMSSTMETYGDVEFFKMLEEKTHIHIKWDHNTSDESFSMMIASGVYPDMINWVLNNAAGGVQTLLDDGVILDLTELIPEFAPNYWLWLEKNPEDLKKPYQMEDGRLFQFIALMGDPDTQQMADYKTLGPQIRKDWLDKVGKEIPTTTDELHDVLLAFRDTDVNGDGDASDEVPFVVAKGMEALNAIAGSFGTRPDFHMDGEELVYGPMTDNFRKFLTYAHQLYADGLINTDFAVNGDALMLITQNKAGFTIASMASCLIANHEALKLQDESYDYVSVPWLIGPDGRQSSMSNRGSNPRATAVTTTCKNPQAAVRWLDYAYSPKGAVEATFGIEGKSFEYRDGYPTILESVRNNDKGWTEEQSISRWMLGAINYPMARDYRFYEQMNLDQPYKVDIQTNWKLAKDDTVVPPATMSTEEAAVYSGVVSDIKTFVDTSYQEFLIGEKSIETDWDAYVQTIRDMGVQKALDSRGAAIARYNK